MTGRIYPSLESSVGLGIFSDDGARVHYDSIEYYDGLSNVFPDRPLNSSSLLVLDTPEETGNYTWWPRN